MISGKKNSRKAYNIDVESLRYLPANVYWKNKEGIYLGGNDEVFDTFGIGSEKNFIGSTLYDYSHHLDPILFEKVDVSIMQSGKPLCLIEKGIKEHYPTYLTTKLPLLNQNGEVSGLVGISFNIKKSPSQNLTSILFNNNPVMRSQYVNHVNQAFYESLDAQGIHLTQREKECLQLLIQGRTLKDIGRFLNISSRTVETYINSVKSKMNCNTKSQLLDKIIPFYPIDKH